jgi:hypothetical protein
MRLSQQELVNAISLHIAERKQVAPSEVEVELLWDEELGFSTEVVIRGRSQFLVEANMLEAIERYMLNHHNMRVFRSQITLDVEDEMFADIAV